MLKKVIVKFIKLLIRISTQLTLSFNSLIIQVMTLANAKNERKMQSNISAQLLHNQYYLIGHFFLSKGDYFTADKMYLQALSYNNSSPMRHCYPSNSLDNLHFQKSTQHIRQFDFLIVPTFMCGSTALTERLNLHPELLIIPKRELDSAIEQHSLPVLLENYHTLCLQKRFDVKLGLVQHGFISGLTANETVAEELAKVTNTEYFIQSVRDPAALICSVYNNELVGNKKFKLSLSFKCSNQHSIFNGTQIRMDNNIISTLYKLKKIKPLKETILIPNDELLKLFSSVINLASHYKVGSIYKKYFDRWETIDICSNNSDFSCSDIKKLFNIVNVKTDLQLPLYDSINYSLISRLMCSNFLIIEYLNHRVHLTISIAGFGHASSTFPTIELYWCKNQEFSEILKLKNVTFSLNADYYQWKQIPESIREKFLSSHFPEMIFKKILIPHWIQNYLIWEKVIYPFFLKNLNEEKYKVVKNKLGKDLENFLMIHPEYEKKWSSVKWLSSDFCRRQL